MSIRAMEWAWELPGLDTAETMVLVIMGDSSHEDVSSVSLSLLSRRSKLAVRSVERVIDRLCELGLVERLDEAPADVPAMFRLHLPAAVCCGGGAS